MKRRLSLVLLAGLLLAARFCADQDDPHRQFELRANSAEFWNLFEKDVKLTTVASGFGFTEGPVWDPEGFLYVSDEVTNQILRVYLDGKKEELVALGDPDGSTFDKRQNLIDCASVLRAIIRIDRQGKYQILADHFEGKRFNSPNDVVIGPDGALYFTDPTLDLPEGQKREISFQGVYRLDDSGKVTLLTKELAQPNGLAFSPDGRRFYVDDSERRNIRVFEFTPEHLLASGRVFAEESGQRGDGVPDGMKLDEAGNIYVTGPKGIWVWDQNGHHLGTIIVPEQPANLAWGDADYGTLYMTASTSVYRIRTKVRGFVPYLTK